MHIDEWLDDVVMEEISEGEKAARLYLEVFRFPAWKQSLLLPLLACKSIFCTYEGKRYRCTGASRMGDVWLTRDFKKSSGYDSGMRVDVDKVADWGATA